jgi:hypothetical protein
MSKSTAAQKIMIEVAKGIRSRKIYRNKKALPGE